jgi:DNA-binding CsgD family transcriptional regulator
VRASASWPRLATGVLDLLREAVLVLSRDAQVLGSNRVADALLAEADGIAISAGGVVASTPAATRALHCGILRAAYGEKARVEVPRLRRAPLKLLIEPHPEGTGGSVAVVFAIERAAREPREADLVRHGLTPTECCVARLLCAGADLERVAHELAITRNTVRGHLKQIFAKTHSHRQAELVCKLLSEA